MSRRVVAFSGGIGGAKLALGLDRTLAPGALTVVANPGDDFEHLGLTVCPDLDTVMYTLAGLANAETGWGLAGETWRFMDAIERVGGETWFRLGDADLAVHVERTRRLRRGESLAAITDDLRRRLGVRSVLLPATDDAVRTVVETPDGPLAFQHYFVRDACVPRVVALRYEGAESAVAVPEVIELLADPALECVVICPSNPYLSIDPMRAIPELAAALERCAAPVVAVSPVVGGESLKGPTAKIMRELGREVSVATVARHYAGIVDALVVDPADAALLAGLGIPHVATDVVMRDEADRVRLARETLALAARLRARD